MIRGKWFQIRRVRGCGGDWEVVKDGLNFAKTGSGDHHRSRFVGVKESIGPILQT